MATFTNTKGERVQSTTNKDGSKTRTVLSTGNPVTATNTGKDSTVPAYNQSVGYSTDGRVKTGITTSSEATNRAKTANETINRITTPVDPKAESPLNALYTRIGKLQADLVKAQEAEKAKGTTVADTVAQKGQTDLNTAATAISTKGTTENIHDPIIRALADKTIANVGIINNQMQTLSRYREQFNDYTQQDIDSISRTAERSVQRQIEESQRTTDAMRFAGVVAGRAQFAPVVEQSIIHEVIQDGLDKVEVINEKKNSAIREARKAEAEFDIDAFEQQSELAKEYNNEIESTISAMNAQVRQVEKDEREKIAFRNAQQERDSVILAEELVSATQDQIAKAAAANGIDIGLLTKAVNDAKFTASDRDLSTKQKQENILSSQSSRANDAARLGLDRARLGLEQARFNREGQEDVKSDIPNDVWQSFRSGAQLSRGQSEQIWGDIKEFGLNGDTVKMWLDSGEIKPEQAKAIVSAHEQGQRSVKDGDDGNMKPTTTETALFSTVNKWTAKKSNEKINKTVDLLGGTGFSSTAFFRE